jgi:hypothetical protein
LDKIVYPVRKLLKTTDTKYSFQDPPHSPRSTTLVVRGYPLPDDRDHLVTTVRSFLVDNGFNPHGELHVKVIDRVTLIVSFPYVDTNDGHKNRPAITNSLRNGDSILCLKPDFQLPRLPSP